jgi:hypothetical protein
MQVVYKKAIIFIQTDLHLAIANKVAEKYKPEDILVLDCRNYSFEYNNKRFFLKLYGYGNVLKTFFSFRKNKIQFRCDELIGNLLTNYNSFFIISVIEYSKLVLIDDGIGTPVILKNPGFYDTILKYRIKNIVLKSAFPVFLQRRFKTIQYFIKDIYKYYSIYRFKSEIPVEHIDIFDKHLHLNKGTKCIIGQPLVELKLIKEEKYLSFLNEIIAREGTVDYYAHPMESFLEKKEINGLIYHKNLVPIEKHFEKTGVPEYIISYYSSSLLHIKSQTPEARIYYIKNDLTISLSSINRWYEMFLEQAGIEKYPLELQK